jgi:polyisoprenoid-binding protein YceI
MKNTYQIDPAHSAAHFSVRHMMLSNVRGTFTGVTGTLAYDPSDPGSTQIDVTIDASTINTGDAKRDGHLKSPDFLDVAQFPVITFKGKRVEKTGDSEFKVTGDLTIHGVTREVSLKVEDVSAETKDPWGLTRFGSTAKSKIDRRQFGLVWNAALETGGVVVGDEVKLEFDLEFTR